MPRPSMGAPMFGGNSPNARFGNMFSDMFSGGSGTQPSDPSSPTGQSPMMPPMFRNILSTLFKQPMPNMGAIPGANVGGGSFASTPPNPATSMPTVDQNAGTSGADPNSPTQAGVPISNTPDTSNYTAAGGLFSAPHSDTSSNWLGKVMPPSNQSPMSRPVAMGQIVR